MKLSSNQCVFDTNRSRVITADRPESLSIAQIDAIQIVYCGGIRSMEVDTSRLRSSKIDYDQSIVRFYPDKHCLLFELSLLFVR